MVLALRLSCHVSVQLTFMGAWPLGTTTVHEPGAQHEHPPGVGGGGGGGVGASVGAAVGTSPLSRLINSCVYPVPGPMWPGGCAPDPFNSSPLLPTANVMSWFVVSMGPTAVPGPNARVNWHVVTEPASTLTFVAVTSVLLPAKGIIPDVFAVLPRFHKPT